MCRTLSCGACPAAAWDPNSHWSRIWDWLQKYVWWEVKNILPFVLFADYWYLQSGLEARGEEETASGSRYPWISRVKKKKKREDVCFRKSQDRTREACFLYPLFKQPYSCCNSPSILVHSGGDSISILVPLFALPISSFFRCVGPLVSFFLFYKVSKNGDLVPLICILNSQRGKKSEKGSFCKTAGRLKGIRASIHVSAAEWHLVTKNAIFIIWRL